MGLYELTEVQASDGEPSVVIVLLHGTFFPNASWARQGSTFHRELVKGLRSNCRIESYRWSGRNDIQTREVASTNLTALLTGLAALHKNVPIVLVGHSHGGTIALRAVSGLTKRDAMHVVCLSTPLLHGLPRALSLQQSANDLLTCIALLTLGPPFLAFMITGNHMEGSIANALSVLYMLLVFGVIDLGLRYRKWALRFCDLMKVDTTLKPSSVLFMRFLADEIGFALAFFQALQYVVNFVVHGFSLVATFFFKIARFCFGKGLAYLLWSLLFWVGGGFALTHLLHWLFGSGNLVWTNHRLVLLLFPVELFYGTLLSSLVAASFLSYLVSLLMPFLMAAAVAPFGWRLCLASLWIELTVESTPVGDWTSVVLRPTARRATLLPKLRHGLGYAETAAIERLVRFIKEKL